MFGSILHKSKPVYECFDDGESWHCYGFYFQLDQKILSQPVFCFIGDPDKLKTMYDFNTRSKIKINDKEYLLPLGFKVKGIWREWDKAEITIPTVIGQIALTAEPLCVPALEAFIVKIDLETEVQNLHHKHSQAKIEQIQTTIKDIDEQLELFSVNLGELFNRIVKERNLLTSIQEFTVNSPIELTQRNQELNRLLEQFHQLDLPNYGLKQENLSQVQVMEPISQYIDRSSGVDFKLSKSSQPRISIAGLKKLISMETIINLSYLMIIVMTISSIISIVLD